MPASRRGTGFINFQDYLGLNQSGAQQLGVQLAQQQNAGNNALEQDINRGTTAFGQQVDAGAPGAGGTYSGPRQFDTSRYESMLAEQQKKAAMLGDNTGRAQLLSKPGQEATWGGSQLDAALAGAGGGAGAISAAQSGTDKLKGFLGLSASNANQYAGQQAGRPAPTAPAPAPYQAAPRPTTEAMKERVERNQYDRRGRARSPYTP